MLYFAIYLAIALAAFGFRQRPKAGRQLYPVLLAFFFLFVAFRFQVGCDWSGYLKQFYQGNAFEVGDQARDPLWWALMSLVRGLGLPYPWLNVISAAIFFTGSHILARKQPDRFAFLVLLWPILIINITMSGIRQAAAIGILCIAFTAFIEQRTFRFVVLVLLASGFHNSAMIFLLFVPLVQGDYSRARIAIAGLLAVPGGLLLVTTTAADVAVSRYVGTDVDAAGAWARVALVAVSGLLFLGILRQPWRNSKAKDYKLMHIGSLAMIGLPILLPLSSVIADRLAYYFVPLQAIIFSRIPFLPFGRLKSFYAIIPYVLLGVTLLVWISVSFHFQQCYEPYQTWLFGMPNLLY